MLGSNPSAVSGTKTEAECSFTPLVFLLPPFWYTRAKSRGSGGWPPGPEKLPFLFCIDSLRELWDQKESPRIAAWGSKDPCVINHFVRSQSMTTDPKESLPSSSASTIAKTDIDRLLQTGLADFSLRELLGLLISSAGAAERNIYLQDVLTDKPNGFYDRSLQVGSIPVDIRVPRTRNGDFRPASIPAPYRRGYNEEVQSLLLGLLSSSRSLNAAKDALQKMGLSRSEQDVERVASSLIEELELRNSRPIHPDMLAVFLDGKYIELREGDKLRTACSTLSLDWVVTAKSKSSPVLQDQAVKILKIGSSFKEDSLNVAFAAS